MLEVLVGIRCYVMVSGYANPIYDEILSGWHTVSFAAQTRGGPAVETVWLNFDHTQVLKHDYSHTGTKYRERIKKKATGWAARSTACPQTRGTTS